MFKYEWTTRSSTVYVILGAHLLYDGVHHTLLGRDFSMLDISTLGRVPVPKKRLALQTSGREPSEDVCIVRYWHLLGRRAIELGKLAQGGGGWHAPSWSPSTAAPVCAWEDGVCLQARGVHFVSYVSYAWYVQVCFFFSSPLGFLLFLCMYISVVGMFLLRVIDIEA